MCEGFLTNLYNAACERDLIASVPACPQLGMEFSVVWVAPLHVAYFVRVEDLHSLDFYGAKLLLVAAVFAQLAGYRSQLELLGVILLAQTDG